MRPDRTSRVDWPKEAKLQVVMIEIAEELRRAQKHHAPMASAHEAKAVIEEEFDELWDEIKLRQSKRSMKRMRKEAIQLAAMAARFILDVVEKGNRK